MNKKTVFIKTAKGENEGANLSVDLKRVLSLIDNKSTLDEVGKRAPPSLRNELTGIFNELVVGGFIRDRDQSTAEPKIKSPKMFVPKAPVAHPEAELDFTASTTSASSSGTSRKEDMIARAREELEAAVAAAKAKSNAEATAKAEAKARQDAEQAARARAVAEANAQAEALARQKAQEEAQARAKLEAARIKAEQEAAARAKAQADAIVRAKAETEAKVRAEIETAMRAKQEAEAKAKREAEEALRAEQAVAARIKAELEAAAKAKAAAEAEAARVRAELEAAKARAEAEARARQEAEARARAEAAARAKAEAEARAKAEAEARAKAEAEARAKAEAEARAKAEAARIKAEQEAAARAKAEAEARAKAEAARIKAEQEAAARAKAEAEARASSEQRSQTEINAEDRAAEEEAALLLAEYERQVTGAAPEPAVQAAPFPRKEPEYEINLDKFQNEPETIEQPLVQEEQPEAPEVVRPLVAAEAETGRKKDAADEMLRLKAEAEAARRKAEEEARRLAEEKALAEEQAKAWAEAEQRAQVQARIEADQAAQLATLAQAKATQKSAPRARRQPLPWGRIVSILFVLSLLVAIALPYVYPMQEFIAPIEQRLSAQLKQPVKIGSMSAATFPPKLELSNITLGKVQEVKVGSAVLKFDPLTLFSEVKVIDRAELQDISIDGTQLDSQIASLKMLGGDRMYPVRRLSLQKIRIISDEIALPVLEGIAEIDDKGSFSRVALHSEDNKYGIDLQPQEGRWQLGVTLKETSLPLLPEIVFSDLSVKGELGDGEVNFSEMDAHIFNGILLGSAKLKWSKGWQLQGRLEAKLFEVKKMFPNYGVEGEMYGEGSFSFGSEKLSQLGDSPRLDASFTVKRGIVSAVDMVETARLSSREHLVGGRTHFDDLIGTVQVENHITHFRQIRIVSGMLSARGTVDVYPDNRLAGNFNAEIKMRDGENILTLYGALGEPKLRAGR
ncbi:MAG: hypothetical protein KJ795_11645 [Gammaproteobacteria bacterium]|nr:hypothetical protein [Gammaproteobacteria bacterium]